VRKESFRAAASKQASIGVGKNETKNKIEYEASRAILNFTPRGELGPQW
jgi:hypothetical protein